MNQEEIEAMYKEAAEMDRAAAEGSEKEAAGAVQEAAGAVAGNEQQRSEGEAKKVEGRRQRLLGSVGHVLVMTGHNLIRTVNTKPPGESSGNIMNSVEKEALSDAIVSANDVSGEEDRATKTNEMTYNLAKWRLRRDVPLAILAWIGVLYIVLMSAQHIGRTLLVVVIAALLAYALTPAVTMFERIMPRFLAISVVYLIVLGGIGGLLYLVI